MTRRRSDDWLGDELLPRIKSKATFGATFFWLAIWAITGFEPWVGFGLFFAWAGSVGLFGGKKDASDDDDFDIWDDEDERGFQRSLGGESVEAARARQAGEPIAEPPQSPLLHQKVVDDAKSARTRLEAAASVGEGELGARLRNMVAKVREVQSSLNSDPSRLSDVQRLFTYYLPATADLLSARGAVAGSNDTKRLAEIDTMIGKLDLAYCDFADRLKGHDARSLDIDMRLLDRSLDEEFDTKTKG
jgi:hypothetical protein